MRQCWLWGLCLSMNLVSFVFADDPQLIQFSTDVRPILADNCFKCHGPDEHDRAADLRLDTRQGMFDNSQSVIPGDLESELLVRILSNDPDTIMPPPDSGRKLTTAQKDVIRQWIDQGAQYQEHWSLIAPQQPALPDSQGSGWARNEIDRFIEARLTDEKLSPNSDADRNTLIRRLSLDLTGMPPSHELFRKYTELADENWYEQLVDELLRSPHYGEHMTRYWLDAARYGDTHGLHLDNYREMWLYRDWVIKAFNSGMPFDQFAIEQLAGDLLESPSEQQLVATGFNRAHVTTNEGGSIVEEVYVRNVVDRVATTGTVFMGLTVGCAQCHDHKFDPISQKDFYQLFAFFNSLNGNAMDGNIKDHAPVLRVMNQNQKNTNETLIQQITKVKQELNDALNNYEYVEPTVEELASGPFSYTWIDDTIPAGASKQQSWNEVTTENGKVHSGNVARVQKAPSRQMVQHFIQNAPPIRAESGDTFFVYIYLDSSDLPDQIMLQFNDGNWEHRAYWGDNVINWGQDKSPSRYHMGELPAADQWVRLEVPAETVGFKKLTPVNGIAFTQAGGTVYWDDAGIVSQRVQEVALTSLKQWTQIKIGSQGEGLTGELKKIFATDQATWNENQRAQIRKYFLSEINPESRIVIAPMRQRLREAETKLNQFKASIPTTLIWRELDKPKQAYILNRGEYDQKGDEVDRRVPVSIAPWNEEFPKNRLGLARWLLSGEHPLTARVTVNRFWQQIFGTGIVETSEDFGAQGAVPSHSELLDWLSVDFVDNGWDVRRLLKQMVMSSTYRQSSKTTPAKQLADPQNRLLARGPRYRLDAESLRDQALAVSGLLVTTVGGPSVKPPQPDGLWFVVGYSDSNTVRFKKDSGHDKVHRRSLYTFWKRTAPPPQMSTFDAPTRETCTVRRERTNTPLQALLLMNDPQYIEAARWLAQQILSLDVTTEEQRMKLIYQHALFQEPDANTMHLLLQTLRQNRLEFKRSPDQAKELIAIGESPAPAKFEPTELAAWTMIANLIMNMDQFVCKN